MTSARQGSDGSIRPWPWPWTRRLRLRHVLAAWSIAVALVLLWQLLAYRGLMALAAEWEFDAFGRYYPALTYLLLVILLGSPILWLLRGRADEDLPGRTFIRALLGIAIGCAVGSAIAVATVIAQPADSGNPSRIVIGTPSADGKVTGAATLVGDVIEQRVAGLSENLFVARRSFRFAPIVSPGNRGGGETVRYFVEIDGRNTLARARTDGALRGILKPKALPGELVRLFRYAGTDVARDYQVLFATRDSLTWPYRVIAVELLLVALLCAIAAFGLHLHRERRRQAGGKILPD
ncbi:hypothetical protein ACT009_00455 [Sphingomonas sp. Tas61C01]|uniref:hypothetical protein n=1 Tax=Sphingomonas sp. Tas61C01 TaxID=3458297 RepID=UPI00403E631E